MTNQASEDELRDELYDLAFLTGADSETGERTLAFIASELAEYVQATIRTEKLKLLDRLSSHQEDLFWWTGGEYDKTTAVDMRAIAAERAKLKEVK